jgi:asparagine synthase (glutamine-hydrolysing)
MCGIAAGVGQATARVSTLLAAVAHRGPDARGVTGDARAAIGAARLRIVGGTAGDPPLVDGPAALAWNGEAYNYEALGGVRPGESDGAAVLRGFRARGPEIFSFVRGPFAAAVLDTAASQLHLVRDPLGVRPLYVRRSPGALEAASEPWPLILSAGAAATIDPEAIAHLLAFQFPPPTRGLVRGIDPLPPGRVRSYGIAEDGPRGDPVDFAVPFRGARSAPELGPALRDAARLHGPCAVRTGVFLSGGIDSSAVAGLLAEAGVKPSVAFVGWFPEAGPAFDERPHARAVAAALGIPLREAPVVAADALAFLPQAVRALGGPCAGPGVLSAFVLARAAAADGVRVVFTGQGGDELFGGYERHRVLAALEAGRLPEMDASYARLAAAMAAAPDPLRAAVFRGDLLRRLLEPEALAGLACAAALLPPLGPDRVDRATEFELERFLPGLLAVDDRALGAFGIEGRPLLLDPVVAEIARRKPFAAKSPLHASRAWFREAAGDALPAAAARRRDKMGFPMPLETWLAGPWRAAAADSFAGDALCEFGFRRGAVRAAFEEGRLGGRETYFCLALAEFSRALAAVRRGEETLRSRDDARAAATREFGSVS